MLLKCNVGPTAADHSRLDDLDATDADMCVYVLINLLPANTTQVDAIRRKHQVEFSSI